MSLYDEIHSLYGNSDLSKEALISILFSLLARIEELEKKVEKLK